MHQSTAVTWEWMGDAQSRLLFDKMGTKVWMADPATLELTFVSEPLVVLLGLPANERLAVSLDRHVHARHRALVCAACLEVARSGEARSLEYQAVTHGGALAWFACELRPLRDEAGLVRTVAAVLVDLTGERRAVEARANAALEYEELVNTLDGIVWEANASLQFTFVSKQAEPLLGYPVARWLEEPAFWVEHLHPDDRDWCVSFCKEQTRLGLPHRFEYRMRTADGRIVWLRDYVNVIASGGRTLRGVMVDITEEKRTQEELERTVSMLRATLESTADGLLVADREGRITASNRKFAAMWRLPEGQWAEDALHALDAVIDELEEPAAFTERVQALSAHPEEESFDVITFKDGRIFERYSRPQRINGAVVGRVWSFRDVTERRRAEAALRESEVRYRYLYQNTPVMMHSISNKGTLLSVSNAWLESLGYERSEVIGQKSVSFLTPESRRYAQEVVLPAYFKTGVCKDVPYQFVKKNGELLDVLLSATSEREPDGGILRSVAVLIDMTERKRAEAEQRRASETQARLYREAQEAIRVRDDFLAIASHELRTPLTPLAMHLQLLERKLRAHETVDVSSVEKALRQLNQFKGLINDLLDVSRIQAGRLALHLEPTSLRELVRELVANHQLVSARHRIELDEPAEALTVDGDRARLAQVISNLLDNAVKYSPDGGTIHLRLARRDGEALLSVRDPGIGIPKAQQPLLFERFFRATNSPISSYGGLGLGLYICRDIIERHGGRIWVESEAGQGATFYVALPARAVV